MPKRRGNISEFERDDSKRSNGQKAHNWETSTQYFFARTENKWYVRVSAGAYLRALYLVPQALCCVWRARVLVLLELCACVSLVSVYLGNVSRCKSGLSLSWVCTKPNTISLVIGSESLSPVAKYRRFVQSLSSSVVPCVRSKRRGDKMQNGALWEMSHLTLTIARLSHMIAAIWCHVLMNSFRHEVSMVDFVVLRSKNMTCGDVWCVDVLLKLRKLSRIETVAIAFRQQAFETFCISVWAKNLFWQAEPLLLQQQQNLNLPSFPHSKKASCWQTWIFHSFSALDNFNTLALKVAARVASMYLAPWRCVCVSVCLVAYACMCGLCQVPSCTNMCWCASMSLY